jgi:hypothetical protein
MSGISFGWLRGPLLVLDRLGELCGEGDVVDQQVDDVDRVGLQRRGERGLDVLADRLPVGGDLDRRVLHRLLLDEVLCTRVD